MSRPSHHPDEDLLVDYAAGSLDEAFAVVIAAHLTYCPSCRDLCEYLDGLGGLALEAAEPAALDPAALTRILAAIDAVPGAGHPEPAAPAPPALEHLPAPVRDLVRHHGAARRWSRPLPGIEMLAIGRNDLRVLATLLRVAPGRAVPRHDHSGREITVILEGAYSDETGCYARGDVAAAEPGVIHRPQAGDAGCTCFVASEGSSRFTGSLGMIQRLLDGRP